MRYVLISLLLCAACAPVRPAPDAVSHEQAGNAQAGLAYAESVCAECHAVAPGALFSPNPAAPPFEEIANAPGMTGLALNVWLNSAHESMPHLIIAPERADDLAAYLVTLDRGG
ncbi:MAG: hypothetical protein R3C25_11515 [Hyphomonadaceae bacterium]